MTPAEQALADLLEWSARMGGWDAPVWDRARAIVDAARNAGDQAPPSPWSMEGMGNTSILRDGADKIVLEVPWDGKQNGDGGVNDALLSIAGTVNGLAASAQSLLFIVKDYAEDPENGDFSEEIAAAEAAIAGVAEGRTHD